MSDVAMEVMVALIFLAFAIMSFGLVGFCERLR